MLILKTIEEVRAALGSWRRQGETIGFVPTMGDLHAGHLSLVEEARRHAGRVVVSIFVNPLQFGANEDFAAYPRMLEDDSARLREHRVDALFAPEDVEIYPRGREAVTQVTVPGVTEMLCGASRPGHFAGVATVVAKLFNIVQPDHAFFGEKDYQQLLVIRRMVEDLCFPVTVHAVATRREADGVAMSSRNRYLTPQQRAQAPALYQALLEAKRRIDAGETDLPAIEAAGRKSLEKAGFEPDYLEVRRAQDLQRPGAEDRDLIILAAARLGKARLIDNLRAGR